MNEIIIETPRLSLRPMKLSDLNDLLKIFGDPKVMASFDTVPFNRNQMEHWIKRNLSHQAEYGYGLFSVIHNSSGNLIGNCGLENMELGGEFVAEIGYDFRRDYWNQGYATEAALAVRDHAFNLFRLPGLISLIRVGNEPSRRVAEKIGMVLTDEITRNEIPYWKYSIDCESV